MLWTHFGASGPLALNVSRHWHRANVDGQRCEVLRQRLSRGDVRTLEGWCAEQERDRPRALVGDGRWRHGSPAAVAERWVECRRHCRVNDDGAPHARDRDGAGARADLETPLPVRGSRGYAYAEVTAGGVPLDEIDAATMESRICPGLYLVGEILDVDGRLGGFNFQWAWSSAGWRRRR